MASTSNKSVRAQPMSIWWLGLVMSFTGELPQGHSKVISMSQQGLISSKRFRVVFFLKLCSLEMSMMARSIPGPKHRPMQNTPSGYRYNIRVGWFSPPREITLSEYSRNEPNNTLMVCFDQWPVYSNYTWQGKVMARSFEGHSKVKSAERCFCCFSYTYVHFKCRWLLKPAQTPPCRQNNMGWKWQFFGFVFVTMTTVAREVRVHVPKVYNFDPLCMLYKHTKFQKHCSDICVQFHKKLQRDTFWPNMHSKPICGYR